MDNSTMLMGQSWSPPKHAYHSYSSDFWSNVWWTAANKLFS